MSRQQSVRKGAGADIRSRIRHENTNLGAGVDVQPTRAALAAAPSLPPSLMPGGSQNPSGGYGSLPNSNPGSTYSHSHHQVSQSIASMHSINGYGSGSENHPSEHSATTPSRPARSARRPLQPNQQSPQRQDGFSAAGPSRPMQAPAQPQQLPTLQIPNDSPERAPAPGRNLLNSSRRDRVSPVGAPDGFGSFGSVPPASSSSRLMQNVQRTNSDPYYQPSAQEDEEDVYGGLSPLREEPQQMPGSSQISPATPGSLGSLTKRNEPAALNTVISALSAAGKKHQTNRIHKGATVSAEEEKRRRRSQARVEQLRHVERRPLESYLRKEDARAFREINAVLRKANTEWAPVTEDDFNAAAFALSLMDDNSLGVSYDEFERMKKMLERALQGTLDDHYEAFASAITLHNNVLTSLSTAQNHVSAARRRLRDSRDALGAKRADLVQMWHKSQGVKEALRLLDTVENLKRIPERLEALMAEKRFLEAVNVLMRGLRTIDKAEIVELAGTTDLRAYLKSQEQSVLEILIEELHSRLYLKSPACDAQWQAYTPGQTSMPKSELDKKNEEVEEEAADQDLKASVGSLPSRTPRPTSALERFLEGLSSRPSFDPKLATDVVETGLPTSTSTSALTGEIIEGGSAGMVNSKSVDSLAGAAGVNGHLGGAGSGSDAENIEENSFLYIEMLLESIARLDKLPYVLDTLAGRLQVEIHQVIDTTIEQVERRNEPSKRHSLARLPLLTGDRTSARLVSFGEPNANSWRGSAPVESTHVPSGAFTRFGLARRSAAESYATAMDQEIMRDLFWTLFSKFDAILQGFRVLYEVSTRINSRASLNAARPTFMGRTTAISSPAKVWRQMQLEVRSLLHDHLLDESQPSSRARRQALMPVNDVLRFGRTDRDKTKRLFALPLGSVNVGKKDANPVQKYQDELTAALRIHLPGLVSTDGGISTGVETLDLGATAIGEPSNADLTGTGHRVLVKPDAFNVSLLLRPTLHFITKVEQVMPPDGEGGSDHDYFLEEFVRETFLPQLEEKAQSLFVHSTGSLDALQEDAGLKAQTGRPVTRSVPNLLALLDGIYKILEATPYHRTSVARLMVHLIVQFYQKTNDRFVQLATIPAEGDMMARLHTCAAWAQRPEILEYLSEAVDASCTPARRRELFQQECVTLLQVCKNGSELKFADLTTSRKKLLAIGTLKHSLACFLDHIRRLQATATFPDDQPSTSLLDVNSKSKLALPLDEEMIPRFQSLPKTFEHLCNVVLFTLRAELRIRAAYHLNLAVSDGNYVIEEATLEPDPHVVDLNADFVSCDDIFLDSLPNADRQFLFAGLSAFVDMLLVSLVRRLRAVNRHGVTKMVRNILALQQNLKSILDSAETVSLDISRRFWELLLLTPDEMLASVKRSGAPHTFEQYKSALHLILGLENVPTSGAPLAGALPSVIAGSGTLPSGKESLRSQYNEYLIELHQAVGSA